jgi:hypothetical protein
MPSSPRRFDCFDISDFLTGKSQWNQPPLINYQNAKQSDGPGFRALDEPLMQRGGTREGAGRPEGATNLRTRVREIRMSSDFNQ